MTTVSIDYVSAYAAAHKARAQAFAEFRSNIKGFAMTLVDWIIKANKKRKALQELDGLTDYYLKDIGVTRGDVERYRRGGDI